MDQFGLVQPVDRLGQRVVVAVSRGMVEAVRTTPNSLGYVDEVQARKAQLSMVAIENASGKFIAPSSVATLAAGSSAAWDPQADFYEVLVNGKGLDAYPIVA